MIIHSNVKTNFPPKLFLTDRQVSKVRKAFENNSSANKTFSSTRPCKYLKSEGPLGKLAEPLQNTLLLSKAYLKVF